MTDYSKYSYQRLLEELESAYLHGNDKQNYAALLLSMEDKSSVKLLVDIYDDVFMALPAYIYLPQYVPDYWHLFKLWAGKKDYLGYELNQCLNENIQRIALIQEEKTESFGYQCMVNLRPCDGMKTISQKIAEQYHLTDNDKLERIEKCQYVVFDAPFEAFGFDIGTNGMNILQDKYLEAIDCLEKYGFIKSVIENRFERLKIVLKRTPKQDVEEKRNNVTTCSVLVLAVVILVGVILYFNVDLLGIMLFVGALFALPKMISK